MELGVGEEKKRDRSEGPSSVKKRNGKKRDREKWKGPNPYSANRVRRQR